MDNSKDSRNRKIVVLLVLTSMFILIALILVIGIGRGAFTGFFELENNQTNDSQNQNNLITGNLISDLEDSNTEITEVIIPNEIINPPSNTSNSINQSSQRRRGSRVGGGSGGGNFVSSPSNPPIIFDNNKLNENLGNNSNLTLPINFKKRLSRMPNNLELRNGVVILKQGDEFEGRVRLNLEKANKKIADFDINFDNEVDLSDIQGDSDLESGKAFMHSTSGLLKNVELYVPVKHGIDSILVCSNASSYDEIYPGCSELPQITNEEIIYLNDSRIKLSEDGNYYIIPVTGTGAMGVNVTNLSSTSGNATTPGQDNNAFAGNITELLIPGGSGITQSWQGYFGNVTGTIILADISNNIMYNWSLVSPEGVIMASTNNSIFWDSIQCFNYSASGNYTSETGGGGINLFGTNLTQLESRYNINSNDLDGVDETFYLSGLGTHNTFYINHNEFSEGECYNTRIFDSTGSGIDNNFEEVLMYEPISYSVVFTAILNEDVSGFDKNPHDFEMLVLEDGHGIDTQVSVYYFYAEMY